MELLICDDGRGGLALKFPFQPSPAIPLRAGHVEATIHNAFIALRAGIPSPRIEKHLLGECDTDLHCPCCKLEGRLLRGQGRKALSAEGRLRAQSHAASSGSVQVKRLAAKADPLTLKRKHFHDAVRKAWSAGTSESLEDLL